jgi:hypothetical protein
VDKDIDDINVGRTSLDHADTIQAAISDSLHMEEAASDEMDPHEIGDILDIITLLLSGQVERFTARLHYFEKQLHVLESLYAEDGVSVERLLLSVGIMAGQLRILRRRRRLLGGMLVMMSDL